MSPEEIQRIRERNRKAYPGVARMVDQWREFFPDMQVISVTRRTKEEAEAIKEEWRRRAALNTEPEEPRE